ncbi:MAG: hypothetical protein ACEPOW_11090 [Bacteroidales bacterium]
MKKNSIVMGLVFAFLVGIISLAIAKEDKDDKKNDPRFFPIPGMPGDKIKDYSLSPGIMRKDANGNYYVFCPTYVGNATCINLVYK